MNFITKRIAALTRLAILAGLATMWPYFVCAQLASPYPAATTPDAQRNALNNLRSHVNWLQNSTRTAPNFVRGGADMVGQQFQELRGAYDGFESTLTLEQLNYCTDELVDLEDGLDILQEVFGAYQDTVARGQPETHALRNMCQVLHQAVVVWVQQLNQGCKRLRIGSQ